jgi:hypothetical protein
MTIYIDIDLIAKGLLSQGEDPTLLFADKNNDKNMSKSMREKFHIVRWVFRLDVPIIFDPTIRIVMQALVCTLLRMWRKGQVPTGVIVVVEKCVEGVLMSWAPFLLNHFLIDSVEAWDRGMEFHYSWLLIMIAFIAWNKPEYA